MFACERGVCRRMRTFYGDFIKLSHVRKIIHSYIQNDKVRVSGGYMSVLV